LSAFCASAQVGPAEPPPINSAAAAKCQVTETRQVGLVKLAVMKCDHNRLSMEVWLPPREKAIWLSPGLQTNVIPIGVGQDVRVSPGRQPRSDYTRPKPVHVLLVAGSNPKQRVTGTLVGVTFH
jgi:hypothetical protein